MPVSLQLLKNGDPVEWERAWEHFGLWNIALRAVGLVLGSLLPQDAEDVAEKALHELMHRAIQRCHSASAVPSMLRRISFDRARDHRRRFWARFVEHPDQDLFDPPDDWERTARSRLEHLQERLRLDGDLAAILDALTEGADLNALEEAVLREHIVRGDTQEEFADSHGVPLGSVGNVKGRLLEKIRRFLDGRGRL